MYYPTIERVIEYNLLALSLLKVKKADKAAILSKSKLSAVIHTCQEEKGNIYDKAIMLLKGIIQQHPFASGNRRTAFITTKDFLITNNEKFGVKDEPSQARVLQGIREDFYTHEEIIEWLKHGRIKEFKR